MRRHPLWSRAPLVLRHWPDLLAAVVAGAFLLGLVAASTPLFLSTSGTDALTSAMRRSSRFGAGLSVDFHDRLTAAHDASVSTIDERTAAIEEAVSGIDHLGDPVVTILGGPAPVASDEIGFGVAQPVRPVFRTGSTAHVRRVAGGGPGVWIQDVTARTLGVEPGDEIRLQPPHGDPLPLRVAGVYRALYNAPSTPFWEPFDQVFRPPDPDAPLPAPFLLADQATITSLLGRLGQHDADFSWQAPVVLREPLDLTEAVALEHRLRTVTGELLDSHSDFGRHFACPICGGAPNRPTVDYDLDQDIRKARETVAGLKPSIDLLAVAGGLVALVVLAAAGLYSINRRRTEVRFLAARGLSPATLGAKTVVESLVPSLAGAAAGFAVSVALIDRFGPGGSLDPAGILAAVRSTAVALPASLAAMGVAAGAAVVKETRLAVRPSRLGRLPWELPVLALAGLALRHIVVHGALARDADSDLLHISTWTIVFPVLFVGGAAGLLARAFKAGLRFLRARLRGGSPAVYLGVNRLASARRLAVTLVTASALAFGIFLYAQTMAASVRATTVAKSFVFTGSDISVPVNDLYEVEAGFPWPYTKTTEAIDAGRLEPTNETVDMLGVDTDTFTRAAFWDDSFSATSLDDLLQGLKEPGDGFLKVVVAGDLPDDASLEIGGVQIPYEVVGRAESFPGKFLDRTLLVVDAEEAGNAVEAAGGSDPLEHAGSTANLWVKGPATAVERSLADLGFRPDTFLAARDVLDQPAFVSVTRTFGFLKALGVLAALLVVVGTLLYVQARQRSRAVSYALARRMGLSPRSHYSALTIELGTMLGLSLIAGLLLGAAASLLVFARVDLLPQIPPRPLLRVPLGVAGPIAAALAAVALAGAWRAHRSAETTDVAEALRGDA